MFSLREDYWETFELQEDDVEFLYNYLLEVETPLSPKDLVRVVVSDRIRREKLALEQKKRAGGRLYLPKERYEVGEKVVFPALGWMQGEVVATRPGVNPDIGDFEVFEVLFKGGERREFAMNLGQHRLNEPLNLGEEDKMLNPEVVVQCYGRELARRLEESLGENEEFISIAGRWFPRALLVDINIGHLNLAEAALDMEGGGPLPTSKLLETIGKPANVNQTLAEFSLDYGLWKDERFDEVGPAGQVLWYLKRLEPEEVLNTPLFLRYAPVDYNRSILSEEMLALEMELDDELSEVDEVIELDEVEIRLIYPHWRVGSLPLSSRVRPLFPTAYKAPRIRFILVDGESGEKFPGWVVRRERYVYGLREFYQRRGVFPGGLLRIRRGEKEGEVIVSADTHRATREWVRTVLVGADGGVVLAMLKQMVSSRYDERMAVVVPELTTLDEIWEKNRENRTPFEKVIVDTLRELAKLNPQGHVHVSELYAAVNLLRRCPPGPIMALLASRPWFSHVGDLHFRLEDSERAYAA